MQGRAFLCVRARVPRVASRLTPVADTALPALVRPCRWAGTQGRALLRSCTTTTRMKSYCIMCGITQVQTTLPFDRSAHAERGRAELPTSSAMARVALSLNSFCVARM